MLSELTMQMHGNIHNALKAVTFGPVVNITLVCETLLLWL